MGDSAQVNLQLGRGGKTVVFRDRRTNPNVNLRGTDENFVTAFNFDVAVGRNLTPDDVEYARPVCLIGNDVLTKVFPDQSPIGETIRIDGQNYTVVGVLGAKGTSFGGSADNFVMTPITRWLSIYGGRSSRSVSINVQAPGQASLSETQEKAIGMMRLVRGLHPEDLDDFAIFTNESLIEAFNKIANVVAAGALVISAIA